MDRQTLLRTMITAAHLVQAKIPPEGTDLEVLAKAWDFGLEVPTQHLEECFKRALRAKRDTYPLSAVEVNTQWEGYRFEVARAKQSRDQLLLGPGTRDEAGNNRMTFGEWRTLHSAENPNHNAARCAFCLGRVEKGLSAIASVPTFGGLIGKMNVFEQGYAHKQEADAILAGFRKARWEAEPHYAPPVPVTVAADEEDDILF